MGFEVLHKIKKKKKKKKKEEALGFFIASQLGLHEQFCVIMKSQRLQFN